MPANLSDVKDLQFWVEQYVNAYGGKVTVNGVVMDTDQLFDTIRKNAELFTDIKEVNGVKYSFFMVENIPLAVKIESGKWEKATSRNLPELLFGAKIAFQADLAELFRLPEYKNSYLDILNIYSGAIFDNVAYTPYNLEKYGLDTAQIMIDEANNNNSTIMIYSGFWHMDYPPQLKSASNEEVTKYMQDYATTIIKAAKKTQQPSIISIYNEPLAYYAGQDSGLNESPFQRVYGKDVLAEAYLMFYKVAKKEGMVVGKDIFFVINENGIYMNNKKTDLFAEEIGRTRELIAQKLQSEGENITKKDVSLGVTMQVRVSDTNSRDDVFDSHGRLRIPQENEIYDSIQKLKYAGATFVGLSEIGVVTKTVEERAKTIKNIVKEALKGGASIIQFEGVLNFSQPDKQVDIRPDVTGFFVQDTASAKYVPTNEYYMLLSTIVESADIFSK
jgi:hypothetical protein